VYKIRRYEAVSSIVSCIGLGCVGSKSNFSTCIGLGWVGSISWWVGLDRVTQNGPMDNSGLCATRSDFSTLRLNSFSQLHFNVLHKSDLWIFQTVCNILQIASIIYLFHGNSPVTFSVVFLSKNRQTNKRRRKQYLRKKWRNLKNKNRQTSVDY